MQEQLRGMVVEIGGLPKDFDAKAHLYLDLGLRSVKALELLVAMEQRFGVSIPDDQFVTATSLEGLTTLINGLIGT